MATITALLAHAPGLPEGDVTHGLQLQACLTPQGQIDVAAFLAGPLPWRARRTWPGQREDWWGELVRVDEQGWALRSLGKDDEPVWDFLFSLMRPGAYLTLRRPNGEEFGFRIVQVEDA